MLQSLSYKLHNNPTCSSLRLFQRKSNSKASLGWHPKFMSRGQ